MPTLSHHPNPEVQTWDQQAATEAELQARGEPPSLPPDIGSAVVPPLPPGATNERGYEADPFAREAAPGYDTGGYENGAVRGSHEYANGARRSHEYANGRSSLDHANGRRSLDNANGRTSLDHSTGRRSLEHQAAPGYETGYNGHGQPGAAAVLETERFRSREYDVGLHDDHTLCRSTETLLTFRRTAYLAGKECEIKDSNGNVVIIIRGHTVSLHGVKDVFSGDGTHLFVLKNKLISLRRRYQGESVDGLHLFEITHGDDGVLECTFSAGALVDDVRNGGVNAPRARIRLNGSFHGGDGDLVYSHPGPYGEEEEVVVANVRHSLMEGHAVVKDDNTYYVKVAPRVDLALIGTICICFDQLR